MARPLLLLWLVPALAACGDVASLETAVPHGSEAFEPRLLGNWEIREDSVITKRVVVTQEGATLYLVRDLPNPGYGDSAVYVGRLGPLGTRRWILELSPVGDTLKYTRSGRSGEPFPSLGRHLGDSSRLAPPSYPLMMVIHTHLVIERADSGLRFALFNGDSLLVALESGRLTTPFAVKREGFWDVLLLTEPEPRKLNAALQRFADRPGALIALPRVGHRIAAPVGP